MNLLKFLYLFILIIFFVGCKSENSSEPADIASLESSLDNNASQGDQVKLLQKYQQAYQDAQGDAAKESNYLFKMASLNSKMGRASTATSRLIELLQRYPQSKDVVSAWTLLGSTYHHKLKKEIQAQTVFQHITASFPNDPLSEDVKPLIKEGPGNLNLLIDQLGNNLYDTTRVMIRPGVANDYIEACQLNALIHPDKVESADFLFKAGETARTIKQHQKAIDIYEWIFNSFSNHPKHGQALFLKAFILDSDLKKYPEAKTIYEEFMTKYPDDDFADDTQFLLNNLGKSDDEIIKSFEKQSQ